MIKLFSLKQKLKITINDLHISEVKYTFESLFHDFLGLDIEFKIDREAEDFIIESEKGEIKIKNDFFNNDNIYSASNIPQTVDTIEKHIDGKLFSMVKLFGDTTIEINEHHIYLGVDLISGTFFMLSRWEEYVLKSKDKHNRFDAYQALSVRKGFYQRPVVNEYIQILEYLLEKIGVNCLVKRSYSPVITFDIDELQKWKSIKQLKVFLGKHLSDLNFKKILFDFFDFIAVKLRVKKDPYDNLSEVVDYIKDFKEVYFFFKTEINKSKFDRNSYNLSDKKYISSIQKIKNKSYKIGLHTGYNNYKTIDQLCNEKKALESQIKSKVVVSRNHYLRFEVPQTWCVLENSGIEVDSTLYYSIYAGFRNGVCFPFYAFDCSTSTKLKIKEMPLIFMETNYLSDKNLNYEEDVSVIVEQVKKYEGKAVILWHNGNLVYRKNRKMFTFLLNTLKK